MRRMLNRLYHMVGYALILLGFVFGIGAAGNSDLGVELSQVVRYILCGSAAISIGCFLTWWKI